MGFESKRQIFFTNENKKLSEEDDKYVFNIEKFNPENEDDIKYLDNLKENDIASYYSLLEKLSELNILKHDSLEEGEDKDYFELNNLVFNNLDRENPGEEYYNRFNQFKKPVKPNIKPSNSNNQKNSLKEIFYRDNLK